MAAKMLRFLLALTATATLSRAALALDVADALAAATQQVDCGLSLARR